MTNPANQNKQFPVRVGDVVALKSHPYRKDLTNVVVSGESQMVSPLMIVIEVVSEKNDLYNVETGELVNGIYKCKCLWYSHKSHQFEERWLYFDMIQILDTGSNMLKKEDLGKGNLVSFNTYKYEVAKRKSSLTLEEAIRGGQVKNQTESTSTSVTPLLSFVSPVMQVCEVKKNESKEPLYDKNKGVKVRERSKELVKCLWYNPGGEKFSEHLIPIEALSIIPIEPDYLSVIKQTIERQSYLKVSMDNGNQTLVQPKSIVFQHGSYFLRGYDYIHNRIEQYSISSLLEVEPTDSAILHVFPTFDFTEDVFKGAVNITEYFKTVLRQLLDQAEVNNLYIRITYKNRNNQVSIRTLKDYKIKGLYELGDSQQIDSPYVEGYCFLKTEARTFRLDRILKLEVIDLNFEPNPLPPGIPAISKN